MRWRFPAPLACAVVFAAAIAICGGRQHTVPDGATIDDRRDDRITGVVGGPLVRTPTGIGAPLDAGSTIVWIWTSEHIEPGQRIVAVGWLRTPRGSWSPGAIDRGAVIASRGAEWEMTARHIELLG